MSGLLQRQKAYFLGKLNHAAGQQLSGAELMCIPTDVEQFDSLDSETAGRVLEMLINDAYVEMTKRGWGASYRLTKAGSDFVRTLRPHRRFAPQYHASNALPVFTFPKAFLLMQFLRDDKLTLTRTRLNRFLSSNDAKELLGFGVEAKSKGQKKIVLDNAKIDAMLNQFVEENVLLQLDDDQWRLTDKGEELVGAMEQNPNIRITLSGADVNRIMEAARHAAMRLGSE